MLPKNITMGHVKIMDSLKTINLTITDNADVFP